MKKARFFCSSDEQFFELLPKKMSGKAFEVATNVKMSFAMTF